jgi:hypothetical protein
LIIIFGNLIRSVLSTCPYQMCFSLLCHPISYHGGQFFL